MKDFYNDVNLFRLDKGCIFVISMDSYKKQIDVFKKNCKVLEVEKYSQMIKRNIGRLIGYIKDCDTKSLKKMFHKWSRQVKIEYIGDTDRKIISCDVANPNVKFSWYSGEELENFYRNPKELKDYV